MLRLYATFSSSRKTAYQINIYDRDFAGDSTQIFISNPNLSHQGSPDDPFKRIIPAKFEVNIPLRLNEYNETILDELVDFYEDLSVSPEGRFYLTVRQLLVDGSKLLFRGKILADINDLQLNFYKDLKITAIDGIEDLKNIQYRPTAYTDGQPLHTLKIYSFVEHMLALLKYSETNKFFYEDTALNGTADVLLLTSPHWTEADQDTGNVWAQVGVRNMWFEQVTPSYRRYKNCYDVLTEILNGFNARCIFSNGLYIIEQLSILDNLTVNRYGYKYNGDPATSTPAAKATHNITTDNNSQILAYPSLKNIAGLKAVELIQSYKLQNYISGTTIQWPDEDGPHALGYVISTGQQMGLALSFDIVTSPNPIYTIPFNAALVIEVEIKIGTYYAKIIPTGTAGFPLTHAVVKKGTNGAMSPVHSIEFTTTPSTIKIIFKDIDWIDPLSSLRSWIFYAGSLEIPIDDELVFTLLPPKIINISTGIELPLQSANIESVTVQNNSRLIISPSGYGNLSDPPDKFSIYEIGDTKNTLIHKTEFPFFDTTLYLENAEKGMYYINDLIDNYENTSAWTDPDSLETYELQRLCMRSILSMRKTPKRVKNIKLHVLNKNVVTFDNRFALSDEVSIPLKMEHDMDEDIYTLNLFTIEKDYDGINIVETDDPTIPVPVPPTIITESATIGSRLSIYAAKTITSSDRVSVDGFTDFGPGFLDRLLNFYSFEELYKRFFVTVGGVEQDLIEPDDPLPALGVDEYTLDRDTNELVFWYMNPDSKVVIKFFD